jgi:C-lobe and N-lobe beta barrels of Tf-binding protein B
MLYCLDDRLKGPEHDRQPKRSASGMDTEKRQTFRVDYRWRSDMTLVNANTGAETTRADLRLSGTLNYALGVNSFTGNLTTAHTNVNDRLNGPAAGRFYGPSAQEIGGVYRLTRTGSVESMLGGFGGKR